MKNECLNILLNHMKIQLKILYKNVRKKKDILSNKLVQLWVLYDDILK